VRINRVEDWKAWKAARELDRLTTRMTEGPEFLGDRSLQRQLRNASSSAIANFAEGFESGTDKEFIRFLRISKRSVSEVQTHLYIARDRGLISKETFDKVYKQGEAVKFLEGGLIRYLKKPRKTGPRVSS
jgi:four helix bundle protein